MYDDSNTNTTYYICFMEGFSKVVFILGGSYVLVGPGSGKGTQSEFICNQYPFCYLCPG